MIDYSPKQFFPEISRSKNDFEKLQKTLDWCFSYIRSTEKKFRKIRSLKVYSNLKPSKEIKKKPNHGELEVSWSGKDVTGKQEITRSAFQSGLF